MAARITSDFELIIPKEAEQVQVELGSEITIPCQLSAGEQFRVENIKWFKETALVCHYDNRLVTVGMGYENRVHLLTEEINKGNVSLSLKDFKESDFGDYLCQVTCGNRTKEITIKVEDSSKKKTQRNRVMGFTVGTIGLTAITAALAFPPLALGILAGAGAVAGAGAAVVVLVFNILFSIINRIYNEVERKAMELSFQLAGNHNTPVRNFSEQAMEGSTPFTERRNSIDGLPPKMSE